MAATLETRHTAPEAQPLQEERRSCPSTRRPVDLVHLARQTMGDKSLEIEVLQIFARQARQLIDQMAAGEPPVRKAAAHRLKGAALAIGAFGIASQAEGVEAQPQAPGSFAALSAGVLECESFIARLCA